MTAATISPRLVDVDVDVDVEIEVGPHATRVGHVRGPDDTLLAASKATAVGWIGGDVPPAAEPPEQRAAGELRNLPADWAPAESGRQAILVDGPQHHFFDDQGLDDRAHD